MADISYGINLLKEKKNKFFPFAFCLIICNFAAET